VSESDDSRASLDTSGHLGAGELAAFLDGDGDPVERRHVAIHLEACAECRSELIAIGRIGDARRANAARRTGPRRWFIPAAALAAGMATLVLLPRILPTHLPPGPIRAAPGADGEGTRRFGTVTPVNDAVVDPRHVAFTWHSASADLYRVVLLTGTGAPVWTGETTDTTLALPDTVPLQRGQPYFWRVDAIAAGIAATAGVHRIRIAP